MITASWVIINRATGAAVMETYRPFIAGAVNTKKYEAVPVLRYLQELNARIKRGAA